MTDQQHPITPPPELVEQWDGHGKSISDAAQVLATQAARWGADQELEACKEWISWRHSRHESDELLFARRPKPLSLKEQSLALIKKIQGNKEMWDIKDLDVVRQALEQLND